MEAEAVKEAERQSLQTPRKPRRSIIPKLSAISFKSSGCRSHHALDEILVLMYLHKQ